MHERPVIAPGLPVLTRPDGELQIGLSSRHRLRIPDSVTVRRTLEALAQGMCPPDRSTRRVLDRLAPALRAASTLVQPSLGPAEMAALSLRHPRTALTRLAARRSTQVRVLGDLGIDPKPLLAASGLGTASGPPQRTVTLVLCQGEPDRSLLDPLVRDRQPYLLLRAVEGDLVLGPFVDPGRTACVRCIDAHLTEDDPVHPVLVSRTARLLDLNDVPEPLDSAVASMALGWAVRDLVRYAEGDPVSTWSATVLLGPDQDALVPTPWAPHPSCGCSWAHAAGPRPGSRPSSTIGA